MAYLIELLLQLFVGVIDAKLLETIFLKIKSNKKINKK
jgi:hypothetical protein